MAVLQKIFVHLRNAGPFSILFRHYRIAKSEYQKISKAGAFNRAQASRRLDQLITWKDGMIGFQSSPAAIKIPLKELTLETDLRPSLRLSEFFTSPANTSTDLSWSN